MDDNDLLSSGKRFVLGGIDSSRLELDFFNLYAWLLRFVKEKKVLDIACGSGLGSFLLAHKANEVVGVDINDEAIEFAQIRYKLNNLSFKLSDALAYGFPPEYFDVVISALTIEQIEAGRHKDFLSKLKLTLKDSGVIILAVTNRKITTPLWFIKAGNPFNQNEFVKSSLKKLIKSADLKVVSWYGQRRAHLIYANFFTRLLIRSVQKIIGRNLGFYGRRERAEVLPVNFWWQPKNIVVVLKKNNEN